MALVAFASPRPWAIVEITLANVMLGVAFLLLISYQIASIIPEIRRFRNPERNISSGILDDFNDDLDIISELRHTFALSHLRYARDRFTIGAQHVRCRVGLLVGAMEKIGIVPLALTAYLAWLKVKQEGLFAFGDLSWTGLFLAGLYLLLLRVMLVAHWMERISLIFTEALEPIDRTRKYESD